MFAYMFAVNNLVGKTELPDENKQKSVFT